jgi:hypothetical protein
MSYQMIWIFPAPNVRVGDYTGRAHKLILTTLSILSYDQVLFLRHATYRAIAAFQGVYRTRGSHRRSGVIRKEEWRKGRLWTLERDMLVGPHVGEACGRRVQTLITSNEKYLFMKINKDMRHKKTSAK